MQNLCSADVTSRLLSLLEHVKNISSHLSFSQTSYRHSQDSLCALLHDHPLLRCRTIQKEFLFKDVSVAVLLTFLPCKPNTTSSSSSSAVRQTTSNVFILHLNHDFISLTDLDQVWGKEKEESASLPPWWRSNPPSISTRSPASSWVSLSSFPLSVTQKGKVATSGARLGTTAWTLWVYYCSLEGSLWQNGQEEQPKRYVAILCIKCLCVSSIIYMLGAVVRNLQVHPPLPNKMFRPCL